MPAFWHNLYFLLKTKTFGKAFPFHYLLKDIWAFSSYSFNLKTANLKFTRISRWRFTSCLGVNCSCLFVNKVLGSASDWNKSRMVPPFLFLYDTHWKTDRGRASPPRTLCELVRQKTLLRTDKCVFHLQAYQYRHRPFHRAATQFLSTLPHRIRPETGQLSPGLIKKSVIFLQHIRELYYHSKMICKHLPPYLCRKNKWELSYTFCFHYSFPQNYVEKISESINIDVPTNYTLTLSITYFAAIIIIIKKYHYPMKVISYMYHMPTKRISHSTNQLKMTMFSSKRKENTLPTYL